MSATQLRSRRVRRLSILVAAVAAATSNASILAQDDSVPSGVEPVVVSVAEKDLGKIVLMKPILSDAKPPEATTPSANKAEADVDSIPRLPESAGSPVKSEPVAESSQPKPLIQGGITVPVLMASDKAAKSTLELRPVAGPLFGRGRLLKQGLFRSPSSTEKQHEAAGEVAKRNPAIPKPPAYIPTPPANTTRPTHQSPPQHGHYQANPRRSGNNYAPLRDVVPEAVPEYARNTKPTAVPTLLPPTSPSQIPSLKYAAPSQPQTAPSLQFTKPEFDQPSSTSPSMAKTPPDVSVPSVDLNLQPRVELNAAKKSEPILVSPVVPKKSAAVKQVPNADVKAFVKESPKKAEDSIADHLRRGIDEERSRQRNLEQRSVLSSRGTDGSRGTDEARNTDAAQRPAATVASRSRQNSMPAEARVGDSPTSAPNLDYVGFRAAPIRIRPETQRLKPMMARTLQYFYDNPEIASGRSNWGMMHAIMVYGIDTRLRAGNRTYSTIAWIAGNNICRGQRLLTHDPNGIKVKSGVGLQGHQAQMLAIFSLCDVPADYPLYAGDRQYSMQHVIEAEKQACKSGEELTFTLIGLAHYLDTDATWIASDGQRWDFQRLIREELSQSIVGTACGGTHRLMGFAHALRKRRHEGKPITGQWARAEQFVRDFISYTYTLQNRDGSMSTNWFEGRGDNGDLDRKIQTTGHMVELLLTVTPDSQLQDPRLFNAVRFLTVSMYNDLGREWKIGPKGHALRSLMMYHDRIFKSGPAWQTRTMAQNSGGTIYR